MSEPFIAQIMYFGGNFAPRGWAFCNGQILSIAQNTALFSILGTTYGGNGQTTFALPNLLGRVPIHSGGGTAGPGVSPYALGQASGVENTTLTQQQMPAHTHSAAFTGTPGTLDASTVKGTTATPAAGLVMSRGVDGDNDPNATPFIYGPAPVSGAVALAGVHAAGTVTLGIAGGSQPVSILQPYLAINAIIALEGIFPSRN